MTRRIEFSKCRRRRLYRKLVGRWTNSPSKPSSRSSGICDVYHAKPRLRRRLRIRGEREEGRTSEPCIISEEKRSNCCSKKREECLGATTAWVMLAVDDGWAKRVLMLRHGAWVSTAPRLPNCNSRWIECESAIVRILGASSELNEFFNFSSSTITQHIACPRSKSTFHQRPLAGRPAPPDFGQKPLARSPRDPPQPTLNVSQGFRGAHLISDINLTPTTPAAHHLPSQFPVNWAASSWNHAVCYLRGRAHRRSPSCTTRCCPRRHLKAQGLRRWTNAQYCPRPRCFHHRTSC